VTPEAARQLPRAMLDAAIAAAMSDRCLPVALPERPKGRTIVVGAGKASAAMARAFKKARKGPLEGLIVTRYGHGVPCAKIEIVEAAHAFSGPTTLSLAREAGIDPWAALADNDGHALGSQIVTGPTLTNVNDFRAILIGAQPD